MILTEAELLQMIYCYKDAHGLTAKDINTEELSNFARWLLPPQLNKHDVSGRSELLATDMECSEYQHLKCNCIDGNCTNAD